MTTLFPGIWPVRLKEQLPPLPEGVVVPDTVEELFDDDKVRVAIISKKGKVLGDGLLRRDGAVYRGTIEITVSGRSKQFAILEPLRWAQIMTYDDGETIYVIPEDTVKLTVRNLV